MHTETDAMKSPAGQARRSLGFRTALVAFAALSLVMTACGDGSDDSASDDSSQAPAQAGAAAGAPEAEFVQLKGVSTSVDLDPSTAAVLQQNKVTVTPVEPATASMNGSTTTVSFPITEGYVAVYPKSETPFIRGTFSHSGGMTFKAGGKSLTATDFIVNPGSSTLTATVGGKGVQLLDLDGTNVKMSSDGGVTKLEGTVAKLSTAAADALNQTFGVSIFKQGIPLGTVRIAATGTAGPGGAPQAQLQDLKGVSTNVDLDPSTAAVLQQNKVSVSPVEPATASMNGSTTTVSFPITEGYVSVYPQDQSPFIRGTFSHSGGLTFKAGGKSLTATDFIVNPGSSTLTATVGGKGVQLLDLDGTNVKMSSDGGVTKLEGTVAKLSTAAADALNQTFGVSIFKQGIPLGTVRIAASETEPSVQTASSGPAPSSAAPASPAPSGTPSGGVATGGGGTSGSGSVPILPLVLASVAVVLAAAGAAGARRSSRSSSS